MLDKIKSKIETAVPDSKVEVHSEDDVHFQALIVSDQFIGLSLIDRQKLIYNALHEEIQNGEIHAISLRTFTPKEWESKCTD